MFGVTKNVIHTSRQTELGNFLLEPSSVVQTAGAVEAQVPWVARHPLRSSNVCLAPVLRTTLGAKNPQFLPKC